MSAAYYRTAVWRALRADCLARDPVCTTRGCGAPSVAADHVVPRSKGGADSLGNLRGLCTRCHNQRRQGGEPRALGCTADGTPNDPGHWWNTKNSSQLGGVDRANQAPRVSLPGRGRR